MADISFKSFTMAGFECSSHRRLGDGARLDLIAATGHDRLAREDYRACAEHGLLTIRDGLRWHLIEREPGRYDWSSWLPMLEAAAGGGGRRGPLSEREPGRYDWSSWLPMLEAAAETGVQVLWDLFHYGSPDHLDQGSGGFIPAYARFAAGGGGPPRAGAAAGAP